VTPLLVLCIAVGAVLGAPARFLVERRLAGAYPWGTFAVNVAGSAVLGGLVAGGAGETWLALVGVGFCGALTTFGGFAAQVLDLASGSPADQGGRRSAAAVGYGAASLVVCVGVAGIAYVTVASLSG
jgi:CrcB protein